MIIFWQIYRFSNINITMNTDIKTHNIAIILIGGTGTRMGTEVPKQFLKIDHGKTIFETSIHAFATHNSITHIATVCHPDWIDTCQTILDNIHTNGTIMLPIITGGDNRQQSVYNGLQSLQQINPDTVLIHDGARPYVSHDVITNVLSPLHNGQVGVIPATPATDTLKSIHGDTVIDTLNRDTIVHAQTPQAFKYQNIWNAHQKCAGKQLTDDASVLSEVGDTIHWVMGCPNNIKITTQNDIKDTIMKTPRIGQGYDVHKFIDGDHVILCGVHVPHTKAFTAHSDGDVAMHALTDAIYGALGDGDIGQHFPPSDNQWKGADSSIFLKHAVDLVRQRGGDIGNVDITIICEKPKIAPHTQSMRERLADIMNVNISQVSVKATTSEKLGFTGREEGIASMATAIIFI